MKWNNSDLHSHSHLLNPNVHDFWLCACIKTMLNLSPLFPDLVYFATESHLSFFTIKIEHETVPKLYFSGHQKGQCMLDVKKTTTKKKGNWKLLLLMSNQRLDSALNLCPFALWQSTTSALWSPSPPRPSCATTNWRTWLTASGSSTPMSL